MGRARCSVVSFTSIGRKRGRHTASSPCVRDDTRAGVKGPGVRTLRNRKPCSRRVCAVGQVWMVRSAHFQEGL